MIEQNKGITLVSLVITIVLLLIIASVTISTTIDESITDRAQQTREDVNNMQIEKEIKVLLLKMQDSEEALSDKEQWLQTELRKNDENAIVTKNEDGNINISYKGYEAILDGEYTLQNVTNLGQ